MSVTFQEYQSRAVKGFQVLEVEGPADWKSKVNPSTLDMRSVYDCVIGQVYGNYWNGLKELDLDSDGAEEHGFNISECSDDACYTCVYSDQYEMLRQVWMELLQH